MKSDPVRKLRLKTGAIVRQVAGRPGAHHPDTRMPDREALIKSGPESMDSGRILEQDRT